MLIFTEKERQKYEQITDPNARKIIEISRDFERFCLNNLKIRTKAGEILPLELNRIQKIIVKKVLDDLINQRPVRYIILKARQEGVSTIVEALIYWWTSTHHNVQSKIVAHDTSTSEKLYNMFRRYYENSHPIFQPELKYNTRNDLTFARLRSQIDTASADNTSAGRGDTINWLHACLHKDSLVVLADGSSKKIEDIKLGDTVFTSSGAIAPITAKTMTGVKSTYKLNTWMTNEPLIATNNHKILTLDGYKELKNLTTKDYIAKPKYNFKYKEYIEHEHKTLPRPQGGGSSVNRKERIKLNYDFGYLVGYYLAEGSITKNLRRTTFTYHTKEDFVSSVVDFFANPPKKTIKGNKTQTTFNDAFMTTLLNKICGRTKEKHVPIFGNPEYLQGLFIGYMDGDGSKTLNERISATSVHEKIARNINRIGDILGIHGSLHLYKNRQRYGVRTRDAYVNSFNDGTSKPHIRKYKFIDGQVFVRVKNIQPYEMSEVYDLEIGHKDHNFETPVGIVSNSEIAMWRNGAEIVAGLMQAVPMLPNTAIFLESTANGIGDYFHTTWQAAKNGQSTFTPLFFSWAEHDEYRLPVPKRFVLTAEEKQLKREFDLVDEQIVWRREKMKEFVGNEDKFYQEYPLTDVEAFLASGSSRFHIPTLVEMENSCIEPGTFDLIEQNSFRLVPVEKAALKVWEQPQEGEEYVIGADVAEGIGNDFSVATIMEKDDMKTVARWRGDIEPSEFGEVLEQLGRFYNRALIAVEINNHGLTTVQRLRDMAYPNLFRRERGIDERFEQYTSKLGWRTDRKTKPLMIDALSEAISARKIVDKDILFIRECMSYVVDERGLTNAQDGSHDDIVMSTAIALQAFEWNEHVVENRKAVSLIPRKYLEVKNKLRGKMKHKPEKESNISTTLIFK